jgi:hypothetical protein
MTAVIAIASIEMPATRIREIHLSYIGEFLLSLLAEVLPSNQALTAPRKCVMARQAYQPVRIMLLRVEKGTSAASRKIVTLCNHT